MSAHAVSGTARAIWRAVRWYVRGLLGADKYDRYLAHHRAAGHTTVPLTEREFWQAEYARQDTHPGSRCC